ncbi:polysaccharide biosynthesis/export family protein [Chitinophaga sancti]|uniref:Polysaccharide biosynthesis/export family protein n=1 Tax=Chitinophaga sancti TaxID=1004 RepID=A0A1K1MRC6_9BACT|nr:polysaccharide biosynthesis/export family protein [Chitinophaga sancti]WQD62917.1 polysaccharide biosynthesis/export family protein [Chitinophaga sancti]WQG91459.1 polysaccharide biosynthesis/export family protein [Chitinophaga sancti]SFW25671.1 polysaccharide export outer membrane protein [Chitinophaga sancti]
MNLIKKEGIRQYSPIKYLWIGCIVLVSLFSCSSPKNITYFKDIPDTINNRSVELAAFVTPTIQADDILQVTIQTLDVATTSMMNPGNSILATNGASPVAVPGVPSTNTPVPNSYLVDKNGYVVLPIIGKIMVAGKTTDQVRDEIKKGADQYYKDPVVVVRFANFKITVLGEVTRPAAYVMPNEKVSILDAIGMAGDLTIYGKRENVLLIRDNNGKKDFVRFNLNDSKLFSSPYFYLHQGDVVYIEPNKAKVNSTDMSQVRNISILTSVISVVIIAVSRINF